MLKGKGSKRKRVKGEEVHRGLCVSGQSCVQASSRIIMDTPLDAMLKCICHS